MKTNSKTVPKFSGEGAVTKMLLNPYTMAEAMQMPKAADLPLPLPAVRLTVDLSDRSEMMSTIYIIDVAWS